MSTATSSCSQVVPSLSHPQKAVASKLEGIAVHSRCCCRRHKQQDTEQRTTLKSRSSESFGKEVRWHYTRPFATIFLTKIFFTGKWHVKITYLVRWAGCPIYYNHNGISIATEVWELSISLEGSDQGYCFLLPA